MNPICRFTAPASRDIEQILDRSASQGGFDAAERLLSAINQKCSRLAQFPMMGRGRPELGLNMRSFPIAPYLVFYTPIENGVEIVRVISGYQDLTGLFADDDE
jgi:toxin ParE1/3/4